MGHHSAEGATTQWLPAAGHHCRCTAPGTRQVPSGTDVPCHVGVRSRGGGRKGSLGCLPGCVSVSGLVSRVEKDAVEPEG